MKDSCYDDRVLLWILAFGSSLDLGCWRLELSSPLLAPRRHLPGLPPIRSAIGGPRGPQEVREVPPMTARRGSSVPAFEADGLWCRVWNFASRCERLRG